MYNLEEANMISLFGILNRDAGSVSREMPVQWQAYEGIA